MTDIADMLVAQLALQRGSFDVDPTRLPPDERAEYIRYNTLALVAELMEMLGETNWKPWATDDTINHELALKEMVDAWHLFMNLMLAVSGVEIHSESDGQMELESLAQWFADRYADKHKVNAQRQAEGYTGTDKCPDCNRDRSTTSEFTPSEDSDGIAIPYFEYCPCGHVYPRTDA